MRPRLAVPHFLKSASVAAAAMACPLLAQAASVQTVFAVENALYGAGYSIGQADGWIDDKLHAAVRQYQADRPGLNATGELDSPTLAALGLSDNRPQLMSGNLVASSEAAKKELGLKTMASLPKAEPEPKPEPRVAKVSKPAAQPQAAPEPVEKPEPKQVAKAQPVAQPEPTRKQAEPEPTSEPIKLVARERASEREEPSSLPAEATQAAPEESVTEVSVNNAVETEAAVPLESTATGLNPEAVNSEATSESQPTDSQGNVITKVFYFLFGWMV